MYNEYQYLTQKQLGKLFGATPHQVGKWLIEVGLRTADKKPSYKAHKEGYAEWINSGGKMFYAWNRTKTISELERHGYRRQAQELDQTADEKHDFAVIPLEDGLFDVVGPTDKLVIRATEKAAAEEIVKLLNLAAKYGKLASLAV